MTQDPSKKEVATRPRSDSVPHQVELATLTVSDGGASKKAAILHASKETTAALKTGATERGGAAETACIQAVIDLEKLSSLAHATDDEFVVGLHREANDHAFNPNDSELIEESGTAIDEASPLLLSTSVSSKRGEIPLEIVSFANAVCDTQHDETVDAMSDDEDHYFPSLERAMTMTTTDENVNVGHDAFLLELPKQDGEKDHHFVLALPERQVPRGGEGTEEEEHHHFPVLERAMTMMTTHLPTDIKDVQLEATALATDAATSELHLDLVIKREVPVIGYLILFFGFFALASAGAAFGLQGDIASASMKTYWRLTSTAFAIFPMAVLSLRRDGFPPLAKKEWMLLPIASFCYAQMTTVFVVAMDMTSLADDFVFSNMTSLVIIVAKLLIRSPVALLEGSGALIGVTGGIICSRDNSADELVDGTEHPHALLGDLISLSASFGTAAYLAIARDLRSKCDLFVFMFTIFTVSSFFVLAFMLAAGEPVELSRHTDYGLFGWTRLTPDRLPVEIFMALVVNVLGTMGYIAVLKYFDSVVVATIMLMEPVVGVFIGYWAGIGTLPGIQTWIGNAIVTIGSGLVVYSGSSKMESIDATKAVRPRSETIDHGKDFPAGGGTVEMLRTPVLMKRPSPRKNRSWTE